MEVFRKIIYKEDEDIISIPNFLTLYELLNNNNKARLWNPIMEIFSEEIWNTVETCRSEGDKEESENYKFSPGKMNKDSIKLYFYQNPIDYVIIEMCENINLSDLEIEKRNIEEHKLFLKLLNER